jgi:hypothetical protein
MLLLLSPVLVMLIGRRLVDFHRKWPPRVAVLMAAAIPTLLAVVATQGFAFFLSPLIALYGLLAGGFTYAVVRPR